MNKTIKVIDLLNKIANGEEVPEYIKYYNRNLKETDTMLCCKDNIIDKLDCDSIYLNDEVEIMEKVEIIEEQQEIDIQHMEEITEYADADNYDYRDIGMNRQIINKLVQAVKQLDKKMNTNYCENCGAELTEDNKYSDSICMDCKYCNDDE